MVEPENAENVDEVEESDQAEDEKLPPGLLHFNDAALAAFEQITKQAESREHVGGISTGFPHLDWYTNGLERGTLTVVAGRPGSGKTAFALHLAMNTVFRLDLPVLFVSMETDYQKLSTRVLVMHSGVDMGKVRSGRLGREDWAPLTKAALDMSSTPLWIDDRPTLTLTELNERVEWMKSEKGIALLVLDCVQQMRPDERGNTRDRELSDIVRGLRVLARTQNIPVVVTSQLNRGPDTRRIPFDPRPQLSDLRDSGMLENESDLVLLLYRDDQHNPRSDEPGIAEVIIAKQRLGPVGTIRLVFVREFTRFENLPEFAPEEEQSPTVTTTRARGRARKTS